MRLISRRLLTKDEEEIPSLWEILFKSTPSRLAVFAGPKILSFCCFHTLEMHFLGLRRCARGLRFVQILHMQIYICITFPACVTESLVFVSVCGLGVTRWPLESPRSSRAADKLCCFRQIKMDAVVTQSGLGQDYLAHFGALNKTICTDFRDRWLTLEWSASLTGELNINPTPAGVRRFLSQSEGLISSLASGTGRKPALIPPRQVVLILSGCDRCVYTMRTVIYAVWHTPRPSLSSSFIGLKGKAGVAAEMSPPCPPPTPGLLSLLFLPTNIKKTWTIPKTSLEG